jgi:hypothetical protein
VKRTLRRVRPSPLTWSPVRRFVRPARPVRPFRIPVYHHRRRSEPGWSVPSTWMRRPASGSPTRASDVARIPTARGGTFKDAERCRLCALFRVAAERAARAAMNILRPEVRRARCVMRPGVWWRLRNLVDRPPSRSSRSTSRSRRPRQGSGQRTAPFDFPTHSSSQQQSSKPQTTSSRLTESGSPRRSSDTRDHRTAVDDSLRTAAHNNLQGTAVERRRNPLVVRVLTLPRLGTRLVARARVVVVSGGPGRTSSSWW